ncbi:hypothetical protein AB6A40_000929 [Gnathostoma spinigerum]|uniref:Translation initiation factor eIF2B subunit beta n=1 Tax=Gnathostoma spinigerum TaxID=75299 RepID=A0ABD6ED31_9BILA
MPYEIEKYRRKFLNSLRERSFRCSSKEIALSTTLFMREIVGGAQYENFDQLVELLKEERTWLMAAEPSEFVISNVVLSALRMVREESTRRTRGAEDDFNPYDSLKLWNAQSFGEKQESSSSGRKSSSKVPRKAIVAALNEFVTEIETCRGNMCAQAADHICTGDIVITHSLSKSQTLREFFAAARKVHKFQVLCVDEEMDDAETLLSVDVMPAMRHATRVVISAAALLPDGSCIAPSGSLLLCLSAKRHSVPVSVCAAFYKVSPCFLPDVDTINKLDGAAQIVPFSESDRSLSLAHIVNPTFDIIPAQLISLYISHTSAVTPPHVYRLIVEYYHPDDINYVNTLMYSSNETSKAIST